MGTNRRRSKNCSKVFVLDKRTNTLGRNGFRKNFYRSKFDRQFRTSNARYCPHKTLAAQLYGEFRELFDKNAVEYFVSYYDYYQPEAYVPSTDTYIDKDATINDAIDRMRHAATRSLLERNDVIIVSSVSCIYGLGSAEAYYDMLVFLHQGENIDRDRVLSQTRRHPVRAQRYRFSPRNLSGSRRCTRSFSAHEHERALRIEWFGDEIDTISTIDPLRGTQLGSLEKVAIYPSTHYAVTPEARERALDSIRQELRDRLQELRSAGQLLEAQRLEQRTNFDLEMMEQMGYCNGIENYSRHLTGRAPGLPPPTLVDYFPKEFLLLIDESHQTIPQLGAMYRGDRSRKETLVGHGFRLPSALDNRPLRFEEFQRLNDRVLYISATPGDYELERCHGVIVEQIIRPTGLIDPRVDVRPAAHQVDDLLSEIRSNVKQGGRILVTTLTKRMAEDLTEFYAEAGVRVRYMHSDIDTLERLEILRALREGEFDVLVGINLLREGLDLPEVTLVAVLDADKEGFLRSERSLIQTMGRAARNAEGYVILYADTVTHSMKNAIEETQRRRTVQQEYNRAHNITPKTVQRAIRRMPDDSFDDHGQKSTSSKVSQQNLESPKELPTHIVSLKKQMKEAADALEFEEAAVLRDRIAELEQLHLEIG